MDSAIEAVADAQRIETLRTISQLTALAGRLLGSTPAITGSDYAHRLFDLSKECERHAMDIGGVKPGRDDDGRNAIRERATRADAVRQDAERELAEFKRLIGTAVAEVAA